MPDLAWSAWICFDFITEILGVKPNALGLKEILIKPSTCNLNFAQGKMPYYDHYIAVKWQIRGKDFILSGNIPQGCKAEIILPSQRKLKNIKEKFEIKDEIQ